MLINAVKCIFYRLYLFRFRCFLVIAIRLENLFFDLAMPNAFAHFIRWFGWHSFFNPSKKRMMKNIQDRKRTISTGDQKSRIDRDTSKVTPEEIALLKEAAAYNDEEEEEELKKAVPDSVDEDGDPLNEQSNYKDLSASDLDIPDEFEDDPDEELGKEPTDD